MPNIETLFVTRLYRAELATRAAGRRLNADCLSIAADDGAGQAWAKAHGYKGYTSYASLDDLAWRSSVFADLLAAIDPHVAAFAKAAEFDLGRRPLVADSIWVPPMSECGTYYVDVPRGASAIRFEDPRLPQMMATPPCPGLAGLANLRLCRTKDGDAAALGKLAPPRGAPQHGACEADFHQLRLPLGVAMRLNVPRPPDTPRVSPAVPTVRGPCRSS